MTRAARMDDRHFNIIYYCHTKKEEEERYDQSREGWKRKKKNLYLNLSLVVARFECVECIVTFLLIFTTDTRDAIQHIIDSKRDKILLKEMCPLNLVNICVCKEKNMHQNMCVCVLSCYHKDAGGLERATPAFLHTQVLLKRWRMRRRLTRLRVSKKRKKKKSFIAVEVLVVWWWWWWWWWERGWGSQVDTFLLLLSCHHHYHHPCCWSCRWPTRRNESMKKDSSSLSLWSLLIFFSSSSFTERTRIRIKFMCVCVSV